MAYARFNTLRRLVKDYADNFVTTNQMGKTEKAHLLQMRSEGYVAYTNAADPVVPQLGNRPYGADHLANWYTITYKGLMKLMNIWPEDNQWDDLAHMHMKRIFIGIQISPSCSTVFNL